MLAVSRVIGHKEWAPGRKSDPRYDMNARRAEVAAFTPTSVGDDMPTPDDLFNAALFTVDGKTLRLRDVLSQILQSAQTSNAVFNSDNYAAGPEDNAVGHTIAAHKYAKQAADALANGVPSSGGVVSAGGALSLSDDDVSRIADALAVKLAGRLES
jgi:hypothetical protein